MRCIFCNCENPDYAVVCELCGEFLPKQDMLSDGSEPVLDPKGEKRIRCSYCWHSNAGESTVCEVCGMPLRYVPYPEAEGEYADVVKREDLLPKVTPNETPAADPVPRGMVRCAACRNDNPRFAVFCDTCGKRLVPEDEEGFESFRKILQEGTDELVPNNENPMAKPVPEGMVRCPSCHNDVPESSYSCYHCGKWLKGSISDAELMERFADHVLEANGMADRRKEERREARRQAWDNFNDRVNEGFDSAVGAVSSGASKVAAKVSVKRRITKILIKNRPYCACGAENNPGDEYCRNCGGRLRKICTCGTENPLDTRFCRNCGKLFVKRCTCAAQNSPDAFYCRECGGLLRKQCACGYANPLDAVFCKNCGVLLQKRCNCDFPNPPGEVFCKGCGGRLLRRCDDCGCENPESAIFCRTCGRLLKEVCTCGFENSPAATFCRKCGGFIKKEGSS